MAHGRIRGFDYIPAEVIKISRNKQHNYMILNKGFEDGIQEKSGIITRSGVVGIVDAVSAHHCYALSFQNSDISISGRFGEDGATGLLVWDGKSSHGAILQEVPLQYKYAVGDTVYTSGHSLMFPPDIPLGVAGDARVINGATNEIQVDLFQDFTAIRYVTVVHNTAFDEVEDFELARRTSSGAACPGSTGRHRWCGPSRGNAVRWGAAGGSRTPPSSGSPCPACGRGSGCGAPGPCPG